MRYLLLLIAVITSAQSVSVQWTTSTPHGFVNVDWSKAPYRQDPTGTRLKIDDKPGWISAIKIGNRLICCCDHYAIIQFIDGIASYCWRDDIRFYRPSAEVCMYSQEIVCQYFGKWEDSIYSPRIGETNYAWTDFQIPPNELTRHGIYMSNTLWQKHQKFWSKP